MSSKNYKDLIVWQKSIQLVVEIYKLTNKYPKEEIYGITSQIRRASVSIPSNIAEGSKRGTKIDFQRFLRMSFGSGAELETQIEISKQLKFVSEKDCTLVETLLDEVMRMLNKTISSLN